MTWWVFAALYATCAVLDLVASLAVTRALGRPMACDCGRKRRLLYGRSHWIGPVMLVEVIGPAIITIGQLLFHEWGDAMVWGAVTVHHVIRWAVHERDKIIRRLRDAARVVVLANGRLGVEANR